MKIIFLDFDGVLNSDKYLRRAEEGAILDPTRLALLKQIVDATQAKIVLTTSWREHWHKDFSSCDQTGRLINSLFADCGLALYDKTPILNRNCGREGEIKAWLDKNPDVENFVVLDDAFLNADFLDGRFVKTSAYKDGLDEQGVEQAIGILNGKVKKKIFVVSDVHGHFTLMKEALDKAGFDKDNSHHLLVSCGDYFDRGNENVEVLKFFERLKYKVLLRGNHEDMLLKLLYTGQLMQHHCINGTIATLDNFFGKNYVDYTTNTIDFSGKTSTVDRMIEFMEETVDYYETANFVFVHGWLPDGYSKDGRWRDAPESVWAEARKIRWTERYTEERPIPDKTLVCGHMPNFYASVFDKHREKGNVDIFYGNGLITVDAGTYDTKRVNVLVIEDEV